MAFLFLGNDLLDSSSSNSSFSFLLDDLLYLGHLLSHLLLHELVSLLTDNLHFLLSSSLHHDGYVPVLLFLVVWLADNALSLVRLQIHRLLLDDQRGLPLRSLFLSTLPFVVFFLFHGHNRLLRLRLFLFLWRVLLAQGLSFRLLPNYPHLLLRHLLPDFSAHLALLSDRGDLFSRIRSSWLFFLFLLHHHPLGLIFLFHDLSAHLGLLDRLDDLRL